MKHLRVRALGVALAGWLLSPGALAEGAWLNRHSLAVHVPVKSWKTLRDARIVKQNQDYSCGAASLAPLLNAHYRQDVTEEAILKAIDKGEGRASFEDMQRALPTFGFKAQGFAGSWEQLAKLKMPVIVYLKHRTDDHFSVLRGINAETVWLADPSLGSRTYSRQQFLEMWETRAGDKAPSDLRGKFLAVLPATADIRASNDFFTRAPRRQTAQAVGQLAVRHFP